MNKQNYQKILENEIAKLNGEHKKLLLHVCCAPCSSYCLEYLSQYFDITVYFYNPNISPKSEYDFRDSELKRLAKEMQLDNIKIVTEDYNADEFFSVAHGLETEPEGGKRCEKCFALRLSKSAEFAKQNGFDYFTTTLSISPLKNADLLNSIGSELAKKYSVPYLFSDFKKKGGYLRSIELSKQYNLYRQNYCGCIFSKNQVKN